MLKILDEDEFTALIEDSGRHYVRVRIGGQRLLHRIVAPAVFRLIKAKADKIAEIKSLKLADLVASSENVLILEIKNKEDYEKIRKMFYEALLESPLSNPSFLAQVASLEMRTMPVQRC